MPEASKLILIPVELGFGASHYKNITFETPTDFRYADGAKQNMEDYLFQIISFGYSIVLTLSKPTICISLHISIFYL